MIVKNGFLTNPQGFYYANSLFGGFGMTLLFFAVFCLFITASLIEFILCAFDKACAKSRSRRIPEKVFFTLAAIGGGMGLWLGMMVFHHKTRKAAFIAAAAVSTVFWVSVLIYLSGAQI